MYTANCGDPNPKKRKKKKKTYSRKTFNTCVFTIG